MAAKLPNSLVQPFRENLLLLGAGWRGFYAPFNVSLAAATTSTVLGPKILDLTQGPFTDAALGTLGFSDIGWIKDFAMTDGNKIGSIRSGYRGAVRVKVRGEVGEKIAYKFREFSRMALKIATGGDVINLLDNNLATTVGPINASGGGNPAVAMLSYDGNVTLTLTPGGGVNFSANNIIVVDKDYDPTTYGLVGENAFPVLKGLVTDVDYIRKTSDFVARVASVAGDVLTLVSPFVGGGSNDLNGNLFTAFPPPNAKVQRLKGWTSRKGGATVHQWTGIFKLDTKDGTQLLAYYPRLAISAPKGTTTWAIENIGTTDLTGYDMDTEQEAMAFEDPEDGQTVVGYQAYYPAPSATPVQI